MLMIAKKANISITKDNIRKTKSSTMKNGGTLSHSS